MFFFIFTLLRIGVKEAKKRKAGNDQTHDGWYDNGNREMQPSQLIGAGGGGRSASKTLLDSVLRFFQFVMGLTVAGLYGVDLHNAHKAHAYADSKWVYAEVTAGLASLTALAYLLSPFMLKDRPIAVRSTLHLPIFVWESILVLFWLTLFGIFGKMYISEDPEGDSGITRMKHAVWVDLTNLLLWVGTAMWCGLRWWKGKPAVAEPFESDKVYQTPQ
jgi:hypothetical protein